MSSGSSIYIIDYNGDDLSFHYSLHLGLEFKWNEFWQVPFIMSLTDIIKTIALARIAFTK